MQLHTKYFYDYRIKYVGITCDTDRVYSYKNVHIKRSDISLF